MNLAESNYETMVFVRLAGLRPNNFLRFIQLRNPMFDPIPFDPLRRGDDLRTPTSLQRSFSLAAIRIYGRK